MIRRLGKNLTYLLAPALALAPAASAQDAVTVSWKPNPEPEVAGYVLYLGTASRVYSTIKDLGNATSDILSGLSAGTVYYCAFQSYTTAGLTSGLSAELSFTSQSTFVSFGNWASSGGLTGVAAAPSAIPFQDGVRNLMKFAFNMNPRGPDNRTLIRGSGTTGLPLFHLDQSGAQPMFTVEFLRRKGSGLIYAPKSSTDLLSLELMTGTTTVTEIDTHWERVVIRKSVSISATPRMFGTVEVTMP